jgi:hypothetical protein
MAVKLSASTSSRQSVHRWRWSCQLYAPTALYPPCWFMVLISVRGWVDCTPVVRLEGWGHLKTQWSHRESYPRHSSLCGFFYDPFKCILLPAKNLVSVDVDGLFLQSKQEVLGRTDLLSFDTTRTAQKAMRPTCGFVAAETCWRAIA